MTRFQLPRPLAVVLFSLAPLLGCGQALAKESPERPNVLLIAIDDLNDWIGCLDGHPQVKTPNIDRLARRGVLFTNAHCQAPICNPSRVSFMTGMLPSTTGVYLLSPTNFRVSPALKEMPTLPEHFAAGGYKTIGCGKIYHNATSTDTFQTYGPRGSFGPLPNEKINHKQGHRLWDWGAFPESDAQMPDVQVTNWAIERLGEKHDKPFLLAVGFHRPHVPLYVPQKWWDVHPAEAEIRLPPVLEDDRDDLSKYALDLTYSSAAPRHSFFLQNDQWHRAVRAYLASIRFVDHYVGQLLDALDESPHARNTIVVLLSDHGFALGEKQRWAKRSLWERSTKVPLIVAGPGCKAGGKCSQPAGLIDVYPTLIELCGLRSNERLEGISLLPQLQDPAATRSQPAITTFYKDNHAVRTERWRFIHYANGSRELYDHESDPHEWHNLAGQEKYRTVIESLARHLPDVNVDPVPGSAGLGGKIRGVR